MRGLQAEMHALRKELDHAKLNAMQLEQVRWACWARCVRCVLCVSCARSVRGGQVAVGVGGTGASVCLATLQMCV
jgi:hypothetical protein